MTSTPEPVERLLKYSLDGYKDEYRELSENWRNLDSKAQGTVSISGIFLAGTLAFVRALTADVGTCQQALLSFAVFCLAASVAVSLLALRIRTVSTPPVGQMLEKLVNDLCNARDGMTSERSSNFYRDQAQMWNDTNREIEKINTQKANRLIIAQVLLAVAILGVTALTMYVVWSA